VGNLDRHLPHLNNWTAHRHVFILNTGHPVDGCLWWHQHHVREGSVDLLTRSMRFSYSPAYRTYRMGQHAWLGSHGLSPFDDDELADKLEVNPAAPWDVTVGCPGT